MKIDLVGNIKIMSPLRLKYFIAVLKSLACFKDKSAIYLNIENGKYLINPLRKYLNSLGFKHVFIACEKGNYGEIYCSLLKRSQTPYVFNVEDDHFYMPDNTEELEKIIETALTYQVEIIPLTFYKMLLKTYKVLQAFYTDEFCNIYQYNSQTFDKLGYNENSIVVGNNCVFSREFALRHWGIKQSGTRPHPYEELRKNLKEESLKLMMPMFEILRPIDDDHGIPNTSCLSHIDKKKWEETYKQLSLKPYWLWHIIKQ